MNVGKTHRSRGRDAGVTLLELSIAATIFAGAMLVSTRFHRKLPQRPPVADECQERPSSSSDILDRLDAMLRSSADSPAPFRILDAASPVLRNQVDDDGDGIVDELDEAFAQSPALGEGQPSQEVWFQRDARLVRDPPACVLFAPDRDDPRDGRDNDGDHLVDEGRVVLRVAGLDQAIAGNVLELAICRCGAALQVKLVIARTVEGRQEPEMLRLERSISVPHWDRAQ